MACRQTVEIFLHLHACLPRPDVSKFNHGEKRFPFPSLMTLNTHMCHLQTIPRYFRLLFTPTRRSARNDFYWAKRKNFQLKFPSEYFACTRRRRHIWEAFSHEKIMIQILLQHHDRLCISRLQPPPQSNSRSSRFGSRAVTAAKKLLFLLKCIRKGFEIHCTQTAYMASLFYTKSLLHLLHGTKRFSSAENKTDGFAPRKFLPHLCSMLRLLYTIRDFMFSGALEKKQKN